MSAAEVVFQTGVIANLKLLNHDNYKDWSLRVMTYLVAEDLWDVVTREDFLQPGDNVAVVKAWRRKDAKALYVIQSSCGDEIYPIIEGLTASADAWIALANQLMPTYQPIDMISLLGAYEPLEREIDANPSNEPTIEEVRVQGDESNGIDETFVKLVQGEEWDAALEFLTKHPEAVRARFPCGGTALHMAFKSRDERVQAHIGKALVRLMTAEDLEIQDGRGYIALDDAVPQFNRDNTEIIRCMLEKNDKLLSVPSWIPGHLALTALTMNRHEMGKLLYSYTPLESIKAASAADFICISLGQRNFDVAWDLIQRYPNLATTKSSNDQSPLSTLVGMPSAFLSGTHLNFWEQWIYDGIDIKPSPTINGVRNSVQKSDMENPSNQRHLIPSELWPAIVSLFRRLVVTSLLRSLGINRIYKIKLNHVRFQEFLSLMCRTTKDMGMLEMHSQPDHLKRAIFLAVERGYWEYILELCRANENFKFLMNEKRQSIFQFAVECRQEKVYNVTYAFESRIQDQEAVNRDMFGNSILHTVGTISPRARINRIRGAALQMQKELQWFQEVEKLMLLPNRSALEIVNRDHMTPREVFTKNHMELVKEAEMSMKETATSCTVVGALIVTMMFAAAFTIPGGNDQATGLPLFLNKKAFKIFIVSDALSLFSSTTSVMIFLGILTSRYAEDDFLVSLPRKMILGLSTLFLAIATMMVAFSSALYIVLHGNISIIIPVTLLASVPITSFIWLQFPFLLEICISTYGRGIFGKNVEHF